MRKYSLLLAAALLAGASLICFALGDISSDTPPVQTAIAANAEAIAPYRPRFGRSRPVVAVLGQNAYTELTDYVIPYAVLARADVAEVIALAAQPGPIRMFPSLTIEPQATIAEFDARFPDGADYLIVPAVHDSDDPVLLAWIKKQAGKGAAVVGVCDGVLAVAKTGLLEGHRATGHWFSLKGLEAGHPGTRWIKDRRYVADGPVITTTGVTASIPVSLALVEAIAGRERAAAIAKELGATNWGAAHESKDFKLGARHILTAVGNMLAFWSHEDVGLTVSAGADEIALSLQADAYSRTYRSQAISVAASNAPVLTRSGLRLVPDKLIGAADAPRRMLPAHDRMPSVPALDAALAGIAVSYGRGTAAFVALQMEYPQF